MFVGKIVICRETQKPVMSDGFGEFFHVNEYRKIDDEFSPVGTYCEHKRELITVRECAE